jgi:hypothetical protein
MSPFQGRSSAGRIRPIEKSIGLIGNRTCDLGHSAAVCPVKYAKLHSDKMGELHTSPHVLTARTSRETRQRLDRSMLYTHGYEDAHEIERPQRKTTSKKK